MTSSIFRGTAGDDNLTGTSGHDNFLLWQGGNDTVDGGGGNDIFRMGAALNAGDKIDGGTGNDAISLNGDYSGGLVFNADTIANVEVMGLAGGHSYNLTLNDGNIAAGERLLVKAQALGASDHLIFDGSAETDGKFYVIAGAGDDTLTGGARHDVFDLSHGGNDTAHGGGGNDTFLMGSAFTAADQIDGGAGSDTLELKDDTSVTLGATTITGIDILKLDAGHSYFVTSNDGNVASGAVLTVDASALGFGRVASFNGAAETDGSFHFTAGDGNNVFQGGGGNDVFDLTHGIGNDATRGGGGGDIFNVGDNLDSYTSTGGEIDGGAGNDTLNIDGVYAGTISLSNPGGGLGLSSIETVTFGAGHSYAAQVSGDLTSGGSLLTLDGSALGAGEALSLDLTPATSTAYAVTGGAGNDTFSFATNFSASDTVNGGAGTDTLSLSGGDDIVFGATTLTSIETLNLSGGSFDIATNDGNVASGATLTVNASALTAAQALTFDGSAETDGQFAITGGAGADTFNFGGNFSASDTVAGGAGNDTLELSGDYFLTFGATQLTGIETLKLDAGHIYNLTSNDNNLAAGQTLTVDFSSLTDTDVTAFNGQAELDGNFHFVAGQAQIISLNGGGGNDVFDMTGVGTPAIELYGEAGDDTMLVGANYNNFLILGAAALDGGSGNDTLEFNGDYSSLVLGANLGGIETFRFDAGHSYGTVFAAEDTGVSHVTIDASQVDTLFNLTFLSNTYTVEVGSGGMDAAPGDSTARGDTFVVSSEGSLAASSLNAGNGIDTLELNGDFSTAFTLSTTNVQNFETVTLGAGHNYNLATADNLVGSGGSFTIDGSALGASDSFTFDGSGETDGAFVIKGGAGSDTITGGNHGNTITGGGGADIITAGAGADIFVYTSAADSAADTKIHADTISGFDAATDHFELPFVVTCLPGAIQVATADDFSDIGAVANHYFSPGENDAAVFHVNSGALAGHSILLIDFTGDSLYSGASDLAIDITGYSGFMTYLNFI